jgi:hypothetical protein
MDVAKVDSGCCIWCNGCTCMLQSVFIWMLHMFHIYVASVLSGCCVCLRWFLSVSFACFKCFICLQTYVASIASECFKSRLSVAHIALRPNYCNCWRGREGSAAAGGGARDRVRCRRRVVQGVQHENGVQAQASVQDVQVLALPNQRWPQHKGDHNTGKLEQGQAKRSNAERGQSLDTWVRVKHDRERAPTTCTLLSSLIEFNASFVRF